MKSTTIAVDLAKTVFGVAVSDRPGHIRQRRRLSRAQFLHFLAQQPPATVAPANRLASLAPRASLR